MNLICRRVAWAIIAVAVMVMAVQLFPVDADGPFSIHDGIWHGIKAERNPANSIVPHHPLFHIIVLVVVPVVRLFAAHDVGHVAVRVVSGAGGVAILALIGLAAGRRRWIAGLAFAAVMFSCRGFIIEAATGENVLPAVAGALVVLFTASRKQVSLLHLGIATVTALLLRQDNLLMVPGVAVAAGLGLPRLHRWRRILVWGFACGVITFSLYALIWRLADGGVTPFWLWLRDIAKDGPWTGRDEKALTLCQTHADSMAAAIIGRHWDVKDLRTWIGPAHALAVGLSAGLLRGDRPVGRLILAAGITFALRFPFFCWFEANNFEWWIMPIATICAIGSAAVRGRPKRSLPLRVAGAGFLLILAATAFTLHYPNLLVLRDSSLMSAVKEAVGLGGGHNRILAHGNHVATALTLLGVDHAVLPDVPGDPEPFASLFRELSEHRVPTTVIVNRFVQDGMPYTMSHRHEARWGLDVQPDEGSSADGAVWRLYKRSGLVFAIIVIPHPHPTATRPDLAPK